MKKYVLRIFALLFVWAIRLNTTIDYRTYNEQLGYVALPSWTHSMLEYCRESDNPCSFLPFQYARANWLWIQTIQYIGTDIYAAYHSELYIRLHDISTLAEDRAYPYIFGQYLIPDTQEDNPLAVQQALQLGRKWLAALCDREAMQLVWSLSEEDYLAMYYSYDKVVPCDRYLLPQALWFVAFYYAHDIQSAIEYYRVAALAHDAPNNLVNMPAIIVARYDDDRKSMMLWQHRLWAAEDYLNTLLQDDDLFFLLTEIEHAARKMVHHGFVSLIQETAQIHDCQESIDCVWQHIQSIAQQYTNACNDNDQVLATVCHILLYARQQWWRDGWNRFVYPLNPQHMVYAWRPDLNKWDIVPR